MQAVVQSKAVHGVGLKRWVRERYVFEFPDSESQCVNPLGIESRII